MMDNNYGKGIASALVKAQKGFSPALKRSQNNAFGSKYADLASCVEAVIDSLNDNGIAFVQVPHEREGGIGMETQFIHESGEVISTGIVFVPATKTNAHGYGSAVTYARRYSLLCAAGIAPEDDDGNAAVETHRRDPAQKPTPMTREQVEAIVSLAESVGTPIAAVEKHYGLPLAVIDGGEYNKIIATLNKKKEQK